MAHLNVILVAGAVALFAAILSPVEAGPMKALEECMQQTGANRGDLETFMKTGHANHQVKCLLSCGMEKIKLILPDGSLDATYIKSIMPDAIGGVVDTCTNKASSESDLCERAASYIHCFMTAEPKIFVQFMTSD